MYIYQVKDIYKRLIVYGRMISRASKMKNFIQFLYTRLEFTGERPNTNFNGGNLNHVRPDLFKNLGWTVGIESRGRG